MIELPLPKHVWWPWNEMDDCSDDRVGFTREFRSTVSSPAVLYVACSGTYQLWFDGQALSIPDAHLPSWRSLHKFVLDLTPGMHRLLFVAARCGSCQPFLMVNLDWQEAGEPRRIVSDESWQMTCNPLPGWVEADVPAYAAWAFDGVWAEPWGMPCNAPEDFCRLLTGFQQIEHELLETTVRMHPGLVSLGSGLQVCKDGSVEFTPPLPYPISLPEIGLERPRLEWYRTREAHSLINNTWLDLFESRCPYVIFDAGAETFARLQVRLRGGGAAILAVTTGESLNEVNRYARRVTDIFELDSGESFATAPTGFRYVKVMVLSAAGTAVLEPVEVQHIRYPIQARGKFNSSDAVLNEVFELSVRTLHLCMQNEIWDGIKRDQLPWMGDLYTEAMAAYLLFGDYRLARRSLAVLSEVGPAPRLPLERQRYPGLQSIWSTNGGDINDIPAYTLWWVVGLWDYWLYSGDRSLIEELSVEIKATLDHITGWVQADGIWRLQSGWDFVDWSPLRSEDRAIYCHLLACRALNLGMKLLELVGNAVPDAIRLQHARMVAAARHTWGQEVENGFGLSHHANAQAICSGVLSTEEARSLFSRTLREDPPLSMTYWHRYLDLCAAQQVGEIDWGLAYIRRHWGPALQIGASTLWEAFDPAWIGEDPHAVSMVGAGYARYGGYETSLCHGWSSGPAAWLLSAVLGVTPAEPGFTRIIFSPNLGDLDWAEGMIPVRQGQLRVSLRKNSSKKPIACLEIPAGISWTIPEPVSQEWQIEVKVIG